MDRAAIKEDGHKTHLLSWEMNKYKKISQDKNRKRKNSYLIHKLFKPA